MGPWSDIYALGMVAYKCISGAGDGELPDAVTRGRTQRKGGVDLVSAVAAGKGRYDRKLLEAIDWAIEVDEEARPQEVSEWSAALAGGAGKTRTSKPARKTAARSAKAPTTARTGMSWSSMALTAVIVVLLGASAWQGWQIYQGMPGVGVDKEVTRVESQADTRAEIQADIKSDTPTGTAPSDPRTDSRAPAAPQTADADETGAEQPAATPGGSPPADEVSRLLAAAEADITARRLTSPVGNNAWEKYRQILRLAPAHPAALAGMERVMGSYLALFGAAVEQEDFDKADTYLGRIRELHPDSPVLEDGVRRIETAKQARADRLARMAAIREHLDSFEAALRRDKLDEAAGYLDRIRALDSKAPALADGVRRLAEARQAAAEREAELERQRLAEAARHAEQFEEAMQAVDLDKAARHLAGIRRSHPAASGLAASEQRLAAAREVEKERQRLAAEAARQAELERQRGEIEATVRELTESMVAIPAGRFRMGDISGDVAMMRSRCTASRCRPSVWASTR